MVVIQPVVLPVGALPVYWDINECPVPAGCDARRVGPCIEGFLRKLGHSGPISITAIGKLSKVPKEILEAVSSTGIRLYDVPYGRKNIRNHISLYFALNCLDPVATHVMLISPPRDFHVLITYLQLKERHIILPFPFESSKTLANVLWTKLLLEEDVKCSETVEPANWVCGVCGNLPGQGFENFWTHLLSQEHDLEIFPWFGNYGNVTFPDPVIPLPTAKATNVEQMTPQEHAPAPPPRMFPWFRTTNVEQKTPSQEYALEMFPRFGTTNVEQKTPSQEISPSFGNDTFLDPGSPSQGHALGVIKLPSQVLSWSKPLQTAKATNVEQRTRSRMRRPSAAKSWEEDWVEATNALNGLF